MSQIGKKYTHLLYLSGTILCTTISGAVIIPAYGTENVSIDENKKLYKKLKNKLYQTPFYKAFNDIGFNLDFHKLEELFFDFVVEEAFILSGKNENEITREFTSYIYVNKIDIRTLINWDIPIVDKTPTFPKSSKGNIERQINEIKKQTKQNDIISTEFIDKIKKLDTKKLIDKHDEDILEKIINIPIKDTNSFEGKINCLIETIEAWKSTSGGNFPIFMNKVSNRLLESTNLPKKIEELMVGYANKKLIGNSHDIDGFIAFLDKKWSEFLNLHNSNETFKPLKEYRKRALSFDTLAQKQFVLGWICSNLFSGIKFQERSKTPPSKKEIFENLSFWFAVSDDPTEGINILKTEKNLEFLKTSNIVLLMGPDAMFEYKSIMKSFEYGAIIMPVFTSDLHTHGSMYITPKDNYFHDFEHIRIMLGMSKQPKENIKTSMNIIKSFAKYLNAIEENEITNENEKKTFNYVFSVLIRDFAGHRKYAHFYLDKTMKYLAHKINRKEIERFLKIQEKFYIDSSSKELLRLMLTLEDSKDKLLWPVSSLTNYRDILDMAKSLRKFYPNISDRFTNTKENPFSVKDNPGELFIYNPAMVFNLYTNLLNIMIDRYLTKSKLTEIPNDQLEENLKSAESLPLNLHSIQPINEGLISSFLKDKRGMMDTNYHLQKKFFEETDDIEKNKTEELNIHNDYKKQMNQRVEAQKENEKLSKDVLKEINSALELKRYFIHELIKEYYSKNLTFDQLAQLIFEKNIFGPTYKPYNEEKRRTESEILAYAIINNK